MQSLLVDDAVTKIGKQAPPQIEYVLGIEGKNEKLSHAVRYRNRFFRKHGSAF